MATTSVPQWSAESVADLEFDSRATYHLVVVTDSRAAAHVGAHSSVIPAPNTVIDAGEVDAALGSARTGWRFTLVGEAASVARVRARIMAAGAIDAEVVTVVLGCADGFGAGARDVFCAHCHATTATDAGIGEKMECAGCGVELVVYHHFSRHHHAYLGYRPDAEELR